MKLIKESRKKILLVMILFDTILFCSLCVKTSIYQDRSESAANMNIQNDYNQLLVNTYLTKITEASDNFYDEYYAISPIVNYYSVVVKKVFSDNRNSYITFKSLPYLGPHDTIGIDEITFSADYLGHVKLENFNHLISYHLPDNLKDLEKKRVPGKYNED